MGTLRLERAATETEAENTVRLPPVESAGFDVARGIASSDGTGGRMDGKGHRTTGGTLSLALLLLGAALAAPRPAAAVDERITYLIETLEESINYRVRVQSIESLDQIAVTAAGEDLAAIVAAITKGLDDSNNLVRYTAASTLIGLGRSSLHASDLTTLIAKLETMTEDADTDVRTLVADNLAGLRSRLEQLQTATSGGSAAAAASQPKRWYVAVSALGDSSNSGRDDLDDLAHQYMLDELAAVGGVEAHGEVPDSDAFHSELTRRNLLGFVLQGSVLSLTRSGNTISAVVSVLVLDQDQNLRVMLKGTGNAQRQNGTLTDAEVPSVQADALRAAVHAAVESLAGYLREL
ncbi:MAG: hypothetical protein HY905_05450 [Deltaproteobacteria bacterium]|nr:hypothetical protein [Deltaproteobacteria bacterium]